MAIDPDEALGADALTTGIRWEVDDVLLYHVSLGAGLRPTDPFDLSLAFERSLQVLPSFAVMAPLHRRTREVPGGIIGMPGIDVPRHGILHARQQVEVHQPIPSAGTATSSKRIVELQDKGSAAIVVAETATEDHDGKPLFTTRSSIFVRGAGGFGGERGRSPAPARPDRTPDHVVERPTSPQQALLYRLCGDRNPLHADPAFALRAGFDRPILHGLATYGIATMEAVRTALDGDVSRVVGLDGRFSGIAYPGDSLLVSLWELEDGDVAIEVATAERAEPVLTAGRVCTALGHDHG